MITVDYTYYKNMYGGSLGKTVFNSLLPKAQNYLNLYTSYKYKSAEEDSLNEEMLSRLKDCTCACVDCLNENSDDGTLVQSVGSISSETVGPWSVTKGAASGVAVSSSQAFLKTVQLYLAGTSFYVAWC